MYIMRICIALCFCSFFSCTTIENTKKVIGNWKTEEWQVIRTGQIVDDYKMDFSFNDDKTYSIDYGTVIETGIFWLEGNRLFTKDDTGLAKHVILKRANSDTLIIEMNRFGQLEELMLIRK